MEMMQSNAATLLICGMEIHKANARMLGTDTAFPITFQ
jgi:hypothetical protein